jgi:hypothetical protein
MNFMADLTPIQRRRILEEKKSGNKEFTIEKIVGVTPNVSLFISVTEQVAKDTINIRDAITVGRALKNPTDITALSPEVRQIIEGIQTKEFDVQKNIDGLPSWLQSGIKNTAYNVVDEAKSRVISHYENQIKLAFAQALLVALLKNAKLIVDGEESQERFFVLSKVSGFTIVNINPLFECQIPDNYFDDSEKNAELAKEFQPTLPRRNPREVAEQEVAWVDVFQEAYPVAAIIVNGIFEDAADKLAYYAYGSQNSSDDEGFRPSNVDTDLENPPPTKSKARE